MKRLLAKLERHGIILRVEHRKKAKRWKVIAGVSHLAYQGNRSQVQAWLAAQLPSNGNGQQVVAQPEPTQVRVRKGESVVSFDIAATGFEAVKWHESPQEHRELAAGLGTEA